MVITELMQGIDFKLLKGSLETGIRGIAYDSRKVAAGDVFVCIPGLVTDGHNFAKQAIANGAAAIIAEREIEVPEGVALLVITDCRTGLPILSSNFFRRPSASIKVVGVTGTNGKTTTTHLIQAILKEAGKRAGILGTLYARLDDFEMDLGRTTPESLDIEEFAGMVRDRDGQYLIMEVSSHALDLGRVDQIEFAAAVFTNLTQDHLDYHKSMDEYKKSKLKLFHKVANQEGKFAVINADDPAAPDFIQASGSACYTYAIHHSADIRATNLQSSLKGTRFTVTGPKQSFEINMKLIGLFSVYNALAAISYALFAGIDAAVIKSALEQLEGVAGRFEQVDCGQNFTVVVDYAHTPDGLENILKTGKEIVENRLITVFGCGGDRDRTKRPQMGRIAAQYSNFCIVTSDNPRSEEPEAIIDDILPGMHEVEGAHFAKIVDRRDAIEHALRLARKGDLVIIAGKGHETYQLVKDQVLHFDDREVAREILKGL